MKEILTIDDKISEIRMLSGHPDYSNVVFVVVEGPSDVRLFRNILSGDKTDLTSFEGKLNVINIARELSDKRNVIAICDADFDHILGISHPANIFVTDTHDIETMTIDSPAFQHMLGEFIVDGEIYRHLKSNFLNQVLAVCTQIGCLRLANQVESLGLNFKRIQIIDCLEVIKSPLALAMDLDKFMEDLVERSGTDVSLEKLEQAYKKFSARTYNHFQICKGHDICRVIADVLNILSDTNSNKRSQQNVESTLRVSYAAGKHYTGSKLYEALSNWQSGKLIQ